MKIIHGQELVNELRKLSDNVTKRLWIAVPYIGSPTSVRRILGKKWFDSPSVNVKLLTDTSDLSCIDTETLQHFHNRGQVKSLAGLHAKIYILDDTCLVTSANLTNTAFSKRHEIGILCTINQSKQVIETFDLWWKQSTNVKPDQLNKIFATKTTSVEEKRISLPTIFSLPNDPGSLVKNLEKRFLNYDRLVSDYLDFAKKYSSVQRIWKEQPLYLEIDGFLDFLFHRDIQPSKSFENKKPRALTDKQQLTEIKKWASKFKSWAEGRENNDWRMQNSKFIKEELNPQKINLLEKEEIKSLLLKTNAGNSRRGNCNKVVNTNQLSDVRNALNILVNADHMQLPERFNRCNEINGIGPSIMNELLGFCYPEKYPLINKNSNCGLRFFGYQIKAYK
jgi:hypothetical protein